VEFRILRGWSGAKSRTRTLDIRRVDFSVFMALLGRIVWVTALERKGVHESWVGIIQG